jgi:hypothetical protein
MDLFAVIKQFVSIPAVAFVAEWRGRRARIHLNEYLDSLSPETRAWAIDLRKKLDAAKSPEHSTTIMMNEINRLTTEQVKLVERLDRVKSEHIGTNNDNI